MTADAVLHGLQVTGLFYTNKFITNRRDIAVGFMTAYLKGVRTYMAAFGGNAVDRDKVIQILTQRTDIKDPQLWADMVPTGSSPERRGNPQRIPEPHPDFGKLAMRRHTPHPDPL